MTAPPGTVSIGIRFPLGRFHATPWDRAVNEGVVEWPPSPWRILRSLIATWHLRCPDIPAGDFDQVLAALSLPPSYFLPASGLGHTRHYMPDFEHQSGATGHTDLVLDPFIAIGRTEELIVRWETRLADEARANLERLVAAVPYIGRSESVCQMRLRDDEGAGEAEGRWWRPVLHDVDNGVQRGSRKEPALRLLCTAPAAVREDLERSPGDVRAMRKLSPPNACWVPYLPDGLPDESASRTAHSAPSVEVIRWRFVSAAPLMSRYGVLSTDFLRSGVRHSSQLTDPRLAGKNDRDPAADDHRHAHWLWLSESEKGAADVVRDLALWMPGGMDANAVSAILRRRRLHGPPGWTPAGFRSGRLDLVACGPASQALPELVRSASQWVSKTPYLMVRHRKRQTFLDYVAEDIGCELSYRDLPGLVSVDLDESRDGQWSRQHRRYRVRENMAQRRAGCALRLTLAEPIEGPLALGALSHFGFGLFEPRG